MPTKLEKQGQNILTNIKEVNLRIVEQHVVSADCV